MLNTLDIFQALADATRLRIFALVQVMELSVGELAQVLGQSQPRVSRHLKIMIQAGLLSRRKEGAWVFLTLGDSRIVEPVLAALERWRDAPDSEMETERTRLEAIKSIRATAAEDYFETHAIEWDAIRSLHVPEERVEAAITQMLARWPVGRLADIGTGTGRMIELLGPSARRAIGIDRSPAMLRVARSKLDERPELGAEWRQGDLYALPLETGSIDTAVLHQVLHYAQHPGTAIAEAARVLAPEGRLLIVDFAAHDRKVLRESDAHAWLGFSDERMRGWFSEAGLGSVEILSLDGELDVRLWLARLQRDVKNVT